MSKNSNFVVFDWMVTEKGLSGNGLVSYAWLYAQTEKGHEAYVGGYEKLAKAIGVTMPTAYNILNKLREMGLIEFETYNEIQLSEAF